jgi:AcrR family transcriptional regulator
VSATWAEDGGPAGGTRRRGSHGDETRAGGGCGDRTGHHGDPREPRLAGAPAPAAVLSTGPPLTERQEERRRRILRAATALACRGGFDAVQMREVAEGSAVALGTLYRYFPSKIHLLVAAMQDQLQQMHDQLRRHPPDGDSPEERVIGTLVRTFHMLQREPQLAEAMVRALSSADRSMSAEADQVCRLTMTIIIDAMGQDRRPTAGQLAAVRVIQHTWQSALVAWLSGRSSIAEVREDLETAARLLAPG